MTDYHVFRWESLEPTEVVAVFATLGSEREVKGGLFECIWRLFF